MINSLDDILEQQFTPLVHTFIATAAAGEAAMKRTTDGLYGFTDCLPGAKVQGVLYGAGAYQKGEVTQTKAMENAYRMGKNL